MKRRHYDKKTDLITLKDFSREIMSPLQGLSLFFDMFL